MSMSRQAKRRAKRFLHRHPSLEKFSCLQKSWISLTWLPATLTLSLLISKCAAEKLTPGPLRALMLFANEPTVAPYRSYSSTVVLKRCLFTRPSCWHRYCFIPSHFFGLAFKQKVRSQHARAAIVLTKQGIFILFLSLSFIDCQFISPCTSTCSWDNCCTQIGCKIDYCDLTSFSCQIEIITGIVGTFGWCAVDVNDLFTPIVSTINITFGSYSSDCINCTDEDINCCGNVIVINNCFTVSTYSALTLSSQSSAVTPPVSSVPPMGTHHLLTHTHFTTSTINTVSEVPATPSSNVSVISTTTIIVLAVVGTALLCIMVAAVFGGMLALVLCKTKRKQFPVTNNSDPMSQQRYTLICVCFPWVL